MPAGTPKAAIRTLLSSATSNSKGDRSRLLLLCGVIRLAEQLDRSRDGMIATVEVDDREPYVILRPITDGRWGSEASVAIWSAQRNSDLLAEAIGKPVEVVGP